MKNTMCLALIILAVLPASAQKATVSNTSVQADEATALAQDYAAQVDGLLRDVHATLQKISVELQSGTLTAEQARELKLAATRDMISRLDGLSAIYDARIDADNQIDNEKASAAGNSSAPNQATHRTLSSNTVSVEELRQESAQQAREIGR